MKKRPKPLPVYQYENGLEYSEERLMEFQQVLVFFKDNSGNEFPILKLQQKAIHTTVFAQSVVWVDIPIVEAPRQS